MEKNGTIADKVFTDILVTPDLVVFYRSVKDINRSKLADKMGYSATYLRMIELGETAITPNFKRKFKEATKLSTTDMTQLNDLHKQALSIVDK